MKPFSLLSFGFAALAVLGPMPAVAADAPAAKTGYVISRMDDARAKDWLERWDKGITGDERSRYCDKAMGEDLGWLMSQLMNGFYYGYLATHDPKWVNLLVDWTDSWIKRGVKEPDGYLGWPKTEAAGTKVDDLDSYDADSLLGEAMALRPVLLMAGEILKTPALQEKYGVKALGYIRFAEQIYEKWDKRGAWRETKEGGIISVVLPYGIDQKTGGWLAGFDRRNAPGNGFSHPNNKANLVSSWLLALADVTHKAVYRDRAERWFKLLKSRMKPKADGTYEIWNYWQPAGPWDYKPDGSTKHWVGVHPNGGYYFIDTEAIVDAWQHGLVFNQTDISRLVATALATNRDWEALVPYSEQIRKKFEAGVKPGSWGGITSIPRYLALQASLPPGPPAQAGSPAPSSAGCAPEGARNITFENQDSLAGWTISGDVTLDPAHRHGGNGGALRVGPGGSAQLELHEQDGVGKVEFWVYDDGTVPANPKVGRAGPRWGLVQADGKIVAPGILYASYLGGTEGYTASVSNGRTWFDQLIWLGVNRAPAGWHQWTLDYDREEGLRILVDNKPVPASIDSAKLGLTGFSTFAIWGDTGSDKPQSVWLAGLSITLGGPAAAAAVTVAETESDPYSEAAVSSDLQAAGKHPAMIYNQDHAPATPALENLPLKQSISQYGITWTFDKPARVGQFVNGDWYVIGPVTVTAIDPKPLYGAEIPKEQLDHMDKERPEGQRVRNGFMLNPPAQAKVAYDSGIRNYFDPALIQKLPAALKPGDSLVSTISMPKGLVLHAQLRNKIERGVEDCSPIRTAAVLTCVGGPQPPDAFRPAFCDRTAKSYLARHLQRGLLPAVAHPKSTPNLDQYIRFTRRPWVGTCFFGFEEPVENMPQYGLEYGRVSGLSALLLCTDVTPEQKEPLLVNFVQIGIDLGGMIRAGHPGFEGFGGHGSGRKLPIVFAGLLLGDDQLANINRSFPAASFGEDEQTAYGDGWTGAKAVFTGHSGIAAATGVGRNHEHGGVFGPYEHTPPTAWKKDQQTSESYRRCCTSVGWVAQALALRLLHAEKAWNHDPFFDYVDRWMYEDDSAFIKTIKAATGKDFSADFARQRQSWEPFVNELWAQTRATLPARIDGWKQPHDETYYKTAIEKAQPVFK